MTAARLCCLCLSLMLWVSGTGCASLGKFSPLLPVEKRLLFQAAKFPAGNWEPTIPVEDAHFESRDGVPLHGWFYDHESPRGVALFMHGNGGNVTLAASTLQVLHDRHHLAVMAFDYRGYGKSDGKPTEEGILLDARAARKWLSERKAIPESQIILMGQSLGGAVAIDLAQDGARALVVASSFTSLADAASNAVPWTLPRWNMTMKLNSLEKIRGYHGPLLVSHGDADETIPFEQGFSLYEAAPGRKRFYVVKGGRHNDVLPEEYRVVLDEFLDSV